MHKVTTGEELSEEERDYLEAITKEASEKSLPQQLDAALANFSKTAKAFQEATKRTCENCAWFREDHEVDAASFTLGFCHRKAPVPATVVEADEEARQAEWPYVRSDDFCGEFQA